MANPSTTGGSGAGTEVIRRYQANGISDTYVTLTVPADHIYILLTMSVLDYESPGSAANEILFGFQPDGSGDCWLVADQPISPRQTFVYSEKVCFTAGDIIRVYCNSTNFDCMLTYIDQQFA